MEQLKIGYQGIEGSNAEQAAKNMAVRLKMRTAKFIPLTTSKRVIDGLKQGNIVNILKKIRKAGRNYGLHQFIGRHWIYTKQRKVFGDLEVNAGGRA